MQIFGVVFQGTKPQLNGQKWDVELGHLLAFGWVLFLCPVLGRFFQLKLPDQVIEAQEDFFF